MGYISIRNTEALKNYDGKSFLGLNRREKASAGEFCDMMNMSSDSYPYICTKRANDLSEEFNKIFITAGTETSEVKISNVRAAIAPREDCVPNGFCGVIGSKFYYNGKEKAMKKSAVYDSDGNYSYGMEIAPDGKIQLLWANRVIIIHGYGCESRAPYIYYYNTDKEGTTSDYIESEEYKTEGNYTANTISMLADGSGKISFEYKAPINFPGGYWDFKIGDSIFIDGIMTYADSRWRKYSKTEITSAVVTGYTETLKSSSAGYGYWNIQLNIKFYNYKGEQPFNYAYTASAEHIYKKIPYMTHLALHKGRLWGANPNGEYVYASSLSNLFEFNQFENLSDDSAFLESSSQGGYLGVISCGEGLVTMKKNEMEVIYGELPNEFAVGKRYPGYGCCDIESCAVADNVLYFLGKRGFYMWSGSTPRLISECLDREYICAYAFTDGIRYYASAGYTPDKYENLVFDIRYGLWHKEDEVKIYGFFKFDNSFYILTEDKILKMGTGNCGFGWYAESVKYFYEDMNLKRINEIRLRVKAEKSTWLKVYVSHDGGEWKECCYISFDGERGTYKNCRVPVRLEEGDFWQYRIEGAGPCVILGIRITDDTGGQRYSNERAKTV